MSRSEWRYRAWKRLGDTRYGIEETFEALDANAVRVAWGRAGAGLKAKAGSAIELEILERIGGTSDDAAGDKPSEGSAVGDAAGDQPRDQGGTVGVSVVADD